MVGVGPWSPVTSPRRRSVYGVEQMCSTATGFGAANRSLDTAILHFGHKRGLQDTFDTAPVYVYEHTKCIVGFEQSKVPYTSGLES